MIQSLARGIEILSILERMESAGVTEIAEELGVDKSTASRLLQTLKEYDMVRLDRHTKKYRLGFRILYLGEGLRNNINVASIARPYMYKLCETIDESIHLAALSNRMVYIIDQVLSKKEYKLSARIGMTESWHCSSVGKCILSYKSASYLEEILAGHEMVKYTDKTIIDADMLKKELKCVRENGYAIDNEERTPGVCCIAVPIFDYHGNVNHCIGISAPKEQFTEAAIKNYVRHMQKYGTKISRELGYGFNRR